MLSPSTDEEQLQSHVRSSPTAASQTHTYRKEHTFIQSDVDNEDLT